MPVEIPRTLQFRSLERPAHCGSPAGPATCTLPPANDTPAPPGGLWVETRLHRGIGKSAKEKDPGRRALNLGRTQAGVETVTEGESLWP